MASSKVYYTRAGASYSQTDYLFSVADVPTYGTAAAALLCSDSNLDVKLQIDTAGSSLYSLDYNNQYH